MNHDDLLPLAEDIAQLMPQAADKHREYRERHRAGDRECFKALWAARVLDARLQALRDEARARFGAARGWKRTRREFHIDGLIHSLHHSPVYMSMNRERDARDIRYAQGRPWSR